MKNIRAKYANHRRDNNWMAQISNSEQKIDRIPKEKGMYQRIQRNKTTMLNAERVRRGLSQQELASLAGVATSDIRRIESLGLRPYPDQARRIAAVLELDSEELQELVELEPKTNPRANSIGVV